VVELALASIVLLWFALGSLDFGRVFYTSIGLTNAAREGARLAAAQGGAPCPSPVPATLLSQTRSVVKAEQSGLSISDSTIAVTCSNNDRWTVTITNYAFQPITPFIGCVLGSPHLPAADVHTDLPALATCARQGISVINLSASATMPVVNQ
jgi:hypothetical protein